MGDVAMMIPSLRCLTIAYPDIKITVVTKGFYKPFFSEFKNINVFALGPLFHLLDDKVLPIL